MEAAAVVEVSGAFRVCGGKVAVYPPTQRDPSRVLEGDASSVHPCESEDHPRHPPLPLIEEAGGLGLDARALWSGRLRRAHPQYSIAVASAGLPQAGPASGEGGLALGATLS